MKVQFRIVWCIWNGLHIEYFTLPHCNLELDSLAFRLYRYSGLDIRQDKSKESKEVTL